MNFRIMAMVEDKVRECISKAEKYFKIKMELPKTEFDIRGAIGGTGGIKGINFNAHFLMENMDHFIEHTVPHEVAHYVHKKYLFTGRKKDNTGHGRKWKTVMYVFGVPAKRCHSYSEANLPNRYLYKCNCKEYHLTVIRHRRAIKGVVYRCRDCRSVLNKA